MGIDSIAAGVEGAKERRAGVSPFMGELKAWAIKTELDISWEKWQSSPRIHLPAPKNLQGCDIDLAPGLSQAGDSIWFLVRDTKDEREDTIWRNNGGCADCEMNRAEIMCNCTCIIYYTYSYLIRPRVHLESSTAGKHGGWNVTSLLWEVHTIVSPY